MACPILPLDHRLRGDAGGVLADFQLADMVDHRIGRLFRAGADAHHRAGRQDDTRENCHDTVHLPTLRFDPNDHVVNMGTRSLNGNA
jgi:hypothetical protein